MKEERVAQEQNKAALASQAMETIGNLMKAHPVDFVQTLMQNSELQAMFESCAKSVRATIDQNTELRKLFKELSKDED